MRDGESLQRRVCRLGITFHAGLAYKSLAREYGGKRVHACVRACVQANKCTQVQQPFRRRNATGIDCMGWRILIFRITEPYNLV